MPELCNFPIELPGTETGQQDLLRRLQQWREVSIEDLNEIELGEQCEFTYEHNRNPLKSKEHINYEKDKPRCSSPPKGCKHFSWGPQRPVPAIFRARTCRHVRLTEALNVGRNKNSQVFAGILGDANTTADGSSVPVAVKIYRASWMNKRCWKPLEQAPVVGEHVCVAMNSFKREFWAYKKLSSLQGTVVPHIYGFFKVTLDDEPCIALVMELINASKLADPGSVRAFCNGLAMATHAVNACGLSMHDFATRNILSPKDHPTFPVLVDFADAGEINEMALPSFLARIKRAAIGIGHDEKKVEEWLTDSRNNSAFIEMFDLPPPNLRKSTPTFEAINL